MFDPKELLEYDGPDRIVHFNEYLRLKRSDKNSCDSYFGAFPVFDRKLDGLQTGELTVISGKTGEGKTLFAESWMNGLIRANPTLKACFFSFEVAPQALLAKYAESPQLEIYLPLELKTADFGWLQKRVWEAAVKENCKLFIFDHLHFLIDMAERQQNMSLNIGRFMRELKSKIALELNVSVILIAHQKGTEEATIDAIRDSSFISQESDNVILVGRRKNFTGSELQNMDEETQGKIRQRTFNMLPGNDLYSSQFAVVEIAKARRAGAFRWKKLFQKQSVFLEEV